MIQPNTFYDRREDMSPDGTLRLLMETDGDMILTVVQTQSEMTGLRHEFPVFASVQFCTYSGGGKSPRVREALIALADAIREENETNPDPREENA